MTSRKAAKAFFAELGMKLEGETQVEEFGEAPSGRRRRCRTSRMARPRMATAGSKSLKFHAAGGQSRAGKRAGRTCWAYAASCSPSTTSTTSSPACAATAPTCCEMAQYEDKAYGFCSTRGRGHHHRTGRAAEPRPRHSQQAGGDPMSQFMGHGTAIGSIGWTELTCRSAHHARNAVAGPARPRGESQPRGLPAMAFRMHSRRRSVIDLARPRRWTPDPPDMPRRRPRTPESCTRER